MLQAAKKPVAPLLRLVNVTVRGTPPFVREALNAANGAELTVTLAF